MCKTEKMKTTQKRIIDEAFNSFLTKGYENTSMNYLANKVNITKPAIYYYFEDKQQLLSAVLNNLLNFIDGKYYDVFNLNLSLESTLEKLFLSVKEVNKLFQDLTQLPTEKFNYHRFFFDCIKNLSSNSLIQESYERHKSLLTEKIRQGKENHQIPSDLDPEILAISLIAILEGIYLMSLYLPSLDVDLVVKQMFLTFKQILFL